MDERDAKIAATIGAGIRACRQRLGWSQARLAERLDVAVEYVSMLERGTRLPSVGMLVAIADAVGVSVDAVVGARGPEPELDEALALLRAVPTEARPAVLAMLKSVAASYGAPRPRRRRAEPAARLKAPGVEAPSPEASGEQPSKPEPPARRPRRRS